MPFSIQRLAGVGKSIISCRSPPALLAVLVEERHDFAQVINVVFMASQMGREVEAFV